MLTQRMIFDARLNITFDAATERPRAH
jgi:hypothetical protein